MSPFPLVTARPMEPQTEVMCGLVSELHAAPLTWTNEVSTSQRSKVLPKGSRRQSQHSPCIQQTYDTVASPLVSTSRDDNWGALGKGFSFNPHLMLDAAIVLKVVDSGSGDLNFWVTSLA